MNNTIIKFSVKKCHKDMFKVLNVLKNITKKSFDVEKYNCIYLNIIEEGFKISSFEDFSKTELNDIHNAITSMYKDYNCYYLDNKHFKGCIKEYLFDNGCYVESIYK